MKAQQLRQEAETEWEAAKTRFERKLLGAEIDPLKRTLENRYIYF
jgi:hypothetical protein